MEQKIENILNNDSGKEVWPNKEAYLKFCEGEPDAIVIFGNSLVERKVDGTKLVGGYGHVNIHGNLNGGHARNTVAAELYKYFPNAAVVTNSWVKSEGPLSYAEVTAAQLKAYGVPAESIEVQKESYSNFTEILELIKRINKNGWRHPIIPMNEFQIPRAKAMLNHINELHDPSGEWKKPEVQDALTKFSAIKNEVKISFVSAEDILPLINERYAKIVKAAKELPAWKETMERENLGAEQVNNGEYWKNSPSTLIKGE